MSNRHEGSHRRGNYVQRPKAAQFCFLSAAIVIASPAAVASFFCSKPLTLPWRHASGFPRAFLIVCALGPARSRVDPSRERQAGSNRIALGNYRRSDVYRLHVRSRDLCFQRALDRRSVLASTTLWPRGARYCPTLCRRLSTQPFQSVARPIDDSSLRRRFRSVADSRQIGFSGCQVVTDRLMQF
jgi:hypothetical protein